MTTPELEHILNELRNLTAETEIVEFKEAKNGYDFNKLGKYFSALSNEANLIGKSHAWLVFGIEDKQRKIKINNLLSELRRNDIIKNEGTFKDSKWVLINTTY